MTAFEDICRDLEARGVRLIESTRLPVLAELEASLALALPLTQQINAWESRWPLNFFRQQDASKLSQTMLDRLVLGEAMPADRYDALIGQRARIRELYGTLAAEVGGCITLSATGAAPLGLASTGNPVFAVPASYLGAPAVSLPLARSEGLPLGIQLVGFVGGDVPLLAAAAWLERAMGQP